jgi:RNA-directed DNA polymerase
VAKYYPSVDNDLMKAAVRRKIKDQDVLWLCDDIIDSMQGLPIGNYTSQHFGNLYLNQFDWWMKQTIKPLGYFRYCDDILVMSNSTKELIGIKAKIVEKLKQLHLVIKSNWNIYNIYKNGVDFVGYVFKPDETRLRPTIVKKFKLKCVALKKMITKDNCLEYLSSLMAYKGWVNRCNAKILWRNHVIYFARFFPKQIKGAI